MSACARLLLLAVLPALAGEWWSVEGEVVSVGGEGEGESGRPQFAARQVTAVVVAAEQPGGAALSCRVLRLHDKTVSWVRSHDLQIVCHDGESFTADARVSCDATRDGRGAGAGTLHALRVARPRPSDSGLYECQVNTEPKMSLHFNLTVVDEPVPAVMVEAGEGGEGGAVVGAVGGAATLACSARYEPAPRLLPAPPLHVAWSRAAGESVGVWSARGGVSLESETAGGGARVSSRLTLTALRPDDDGLYTCTAGNVSTTLALHVLPEDDILALETPLEAMQRDEARAHGEGARGARAHLLLPLLYSVTALLSSSSPA